MPIDGWDHLEIWVGNAKQAAYFYENAYGFTRTAYAGPETGVRDRASYLLEQGDIRFVLTSGLRARQRDLPLGGNPRRQRQGRRAHGPRRDERLPSSGPARRTRSDGAALGRGRPRPRRARRDRDVRRERPHVREPLGVLRPYLPGYQSVSPNGGPSTGVGLISIDHVVGNVELGRMDEWVEFYERVLGFTAARRTSRTTTSRPSTPRSCRR